MNGKQTKLSKWLYLLLLGEYDGGIHQHKWIHFIKHILISVGRPDLLNEEVIENPKSIKNQISKTLSDLYVQEWHNKVHLVIPRVMIRYLNPWPHKDTFFRLSMS